MQFKTLRQMKEYDRFEIEKPLNLLVIPKNEKMQAVLDEMVIKFKVENSIAGITFYSYLNNIEQTIQIGIYSNYNYKNLLIAKIKDNKDTSSKSKQNNIDELESIFDITISEDVKNKEDALTVDVSQLKLVGMNSTFEAMAYVYQQVTKEKKQIEVERVNKRDILSKNKNTRKSDASSNNNKRVVKIIDGNEVVIKARIKNESVKAIRKYKPYSHSFEVIGHTRKLKSGKVIWVKPYEKGKGKDKKSKTYIIK